MGQILTSARDATFVDTHVSLNELIDEIDLVQIGQQDLVEFYEIKALTPEYSGYTSWPTPGN